MQPLSFFFDDTMPLRLSETEVSFFLLHGGTTALKERLLQAVATTQVKTEQQQFYHAQSLCCLYFPVQKQVFLDADLLTLLPRLGCPELDTRHIPLHHCYDRNVLWTHAEAIRYSFTELQEKDFCLEIDQKGVDMKIGLDIASMAYKQQVDQIVLISGDSDFVSAAKLARREGIDFILDPLGAAIKPDLFEHIDGLRTCDKLYTTHSQR